MAQLVTGLFNSRSGAMLAVEDLMCHGFTQDDISLVVTDTNVGREFYADVASKAPEGGVTGTIIGGIIGGIITALMSTHYVPDGGTGLAGIPMVYAILTGAAIGAIVGLIIGAAIGASIPEYEMNLYGADRRRGGILVGVYCHRRREGEVKRLMEAAGAHHVRAKTVRDEMLPRDRSRDYATAGPDRAVR